jgi:hypothetical protein
MHERTLESDWGVQSTGKGVGLTKLLEDSLAFPKTLIDFGKLHDNTIERFQ